MGTDHREARYGGSPLFCKVCLTGEFPFARLGESLPTKGNSMDAAEAQIAKAIIARSENCQRGIVGDRSIGGIPIGAYVRVAPDCLLYVQPCGDEGEFFIELCLN